MGTSPRCASPPRPRARPSASPETRAPERVGGEDDHNRHEASREALIRENLERLHETLTGLFLSPEIRLTPAHARAAWLRRRRRRTRDRGPRAAVLRLSSRHPRPSTHARRRRSSIRSSAGNVGRFERPSNQYAASPAPAAPLPRRPGEGRRRRQRPPRAPGARRGGRARWQERCAARRRRSARARRAASREPPPRGWRVAQAVGGSGTVADVGRAEEIVPEQLVERLHHGRLGQRGRRRRELSSNGSPATAAPSSTRRCVSDRRRTTSQEPRRRCLEPRSRPATPRRASFTPPARASCSR